MGNSIHFSDIIGGLHLVKNYFFSPIVDLVIQWVTFRKKESKIWRKKARKYVKYMKM